MIDFCRGILLVTVISLVGCVPQPPHSSQEDYIDKSFIGEGTNDLAKALLQGFVSEDENMVYSPLGYSALLAIFAEGARGESREEIATSLHFPKDVDSVRFAYKSLLERLTMKRENNAAEFKNYFYIYKNFSIQQDLCDVLEKYYLAEVKNVDRPEVYLSKLNSDESTQTNFESVKASSTGEDEIEAAELSLVSETDSNNIGKDEVILSKLRTIANGSVMGQDHFSGLTDSTLKAKGESTEPQMIIFNGLYFRGEWKVPFVKKAADDSGVFYKSEKEKISVSTIRSEGEFLVGNVDALDCKAIELPYKGDRYSLLVLVPNARDGLAKLIADLAVYPMNDIYKQMKKRLIDIRLPSFEMDYISKPISSFKKLSMSKVTSIFDPDKADLSGVSGEPGLFVEDLVQLVSFKVDADDSSANFLSSSAASLRSNFETFQVSQPFLFFLRDTVDDFIVVNGKLLDPTPKPDLFDS